MELEKILKNKSLNSEEIAKLCKYVYDKDIEYLLSYYEDYMKNNENLLYALHKHEEKYGKIKSEELFEHRDLFEIKVILRLQTLKKLEKQDYQTLITETRCIYESLIDLTLITLDPIKFKHSKLLAFQMSNEFEYGKKINNYWNKQLLTKDFETLVHTQLKTLETQEPAIIALRKKEWNKKIHPMGSDRWTGNKFKEDVHMAQTLMSKYNSFNFIEFHETTYPWLNWFIHSSLTGIRNITKNSDQLWNLISTGFNYCDDFIQLTSILFSEKFPNEHINFERSLINNRDKAIKDFLDYLDSLKDN